MNVLSVVIVVCC